MLRVLFVDDEEQVLNGLKRSLRSLRSDWDMKFVNSGQEALEYFSKEPIDVVVSDIRMPGMDGVTLLGCIRETYPKVIRLALSGHAETKMEIQCATAAHQFLAKPASSDELKEALGRASCMMKLVADDEIQSAIGGVHSLPSIPRLYDEITREIANPDTSIQKIANIVDQDVSMSAKVLQLVNSAFFGLSTRVDSISKAVGLIGLETLRSLVLSEEAFRAFSEAESSGLDIELLSSHSLRVASLARAIALQEGQPKSEAENAFMAGMIHNIGKLVLAHRFPVRYSNVSAMVKEGMRYREAEFKEFGVSHEHVGGYLLGIWGLPSRVVEAVSFHHTPTASMSSEFSPLTAVYLATCLIHAENDGMTQEQLASYLDQGYIEKVTDMSHLENWIELASK